MSDFDSGVGKAIFTGAAVGGITGCIATSEVGCVEGAIPGAVIGGAGAALPATVKGLYQAFRQGLNAEQQYKQDMQRCSQLP
jgi:hypothetical protein